MWGGETNLLGNIDRKEKMKYSTILLFFFIIFSFYK